MSHPLLFLLLLIPLCAEGARRCPTSCLEPGDGLVCGSDGQVYGSECELRMKTCGRKVSVVGREQCLAGRQVACEQQCSEDEADPVCGTDSLTYASPCHLAEQTCKKGVKLAHHGACTDLTREEEACPLFCPNRTQPEVLCASNGNVYKSECELRMLSCGERVVSTSLRHCKLSAHCAESCQRSGAAEGAACGSDGRLYASECVMKRDNCGKHIYEIPMAYCLVSDPEFGGCPRDCQGLNLTQVCGSNGNVYSNECELKLLTCGSKSPVTVLPLSECQSKVSNCSRHMCSGAYDPVCGTDGVTYSNMCRLNMAKCLRGVGVGHLGVCYNHFTPDICPSSCPPGSAAGDVDGPVCGSDGNVYPSACEMKRVTCGQKVVPLALKHCATTAHCDVNCPNLSRPICGSDGNLYKSKCHMLSKNCGKHIFMVPLHHCLKRVFKGCFEICPMTFEPSCGTDQKTYSNPCFLHIETCRSRGKVRLASKGRCGELPVLAPSTHNYTAFNELTKLQLIPLLDHSRKLRTQA